MRKNGAEFILKTLMVLCLILVISGSRAAYAMEEDDIILLGQTKDVDIKGGGKSVIFKFEPNASGEYCIYSHDREAGADPDVFLYDANGKLLDEENDDAGPDGMDVELSYNFIGGRTYYIKAMDWEGGTGSYKLSIKTIDIKSISFTPARRIQIEEGMDGYFDEDANGKFIYYTNFDEMENGAILTATHLNGSKETFKYNPNTMTFVSTKDRKNVYVTYSEEEQKQKPWVVGSANKLTVHCFGLRTTVPVTIVENSVQSLNFKPSTVYLVENRGGSWEYDSDGERYYLYDYEAYSGKLLSDNSKLTVNYKQGGSGTYSYNTSGASFECSGKSDLIEGMYDVYHNQYTNHWEQGKSNYLTFKSHGRTAKINVVIVKNLVDTTGVSLDRSSHSLQKGSAFTLNATVKPSNATDKALYWSSSNASVATVDSSGKVTAKGAGSANITVKTSNGKSGVCKITVTNSGGSGSQSKSTGSAPKSQTNSQASGSVTQKGADGTALGKGASSAAAQKAITSMPDDNDPAGAAFAPLLLRSTKQTKKNITLKWQSVGGASKYDIYGNQCGKGNKMQKITTVTGKSYKFSALRGKALKKGKYYKFIVVAIDKSNKVIATSKVVHAATKGGKVGNHKSISTKAKKNKVKIKKGKTFKLGAKAKAESSKRKVKKHRALNYESSNTAVASVSGKGVIKGVNKGSCVVYVYAQNGVYKKIKVTVN